MEPYTDEELEQLVILGKSISDRWSTLLNLETIKMWMEQDGILRDILRSSYEDLPLLINCSNDGDYDGNVLWNQRIISWRLGLGR